MGWLVTPKKIGLFFLSVSGCGCNPKICQKKNQQPWEQKQKVSGECFLQQTLSVSKSSKYLVRRSLKPLKAEPQEAFAGPNTVLTKVFGRLVEKRNQFFFACGIQVFNLHWMGICLQMSPDGLFPWPVLFFANNTYSDWKQRRPGELMLGLRNAQFRSWEGFRNSAVSWGWWPFF